MADSSYTSTVRAERSRSEGLQITRATSESGASSPNENARARRRPHAESPSSQTTTKNESDAKGNLSPDIATGVASMTTATLTPPLGQFVINLLLQLADIVAAVAFGVFAVESLSVAKQANVEARVANQVAMLAICTQVRLQSFLGTKAEGLLTKLQGNNIPSFCSRVLADAELVFPAEVNSLFSVQPGSSTAAASSSSTTITSTSITQVTTTSLVGTETSSVASGNAAGVSSGLSNNIIIAIAVPVGSITLVIVAGIIICIHRRTFARNSRSSTHGFPKPHLPHIREPARDADSDHGRPDKENTFAGYSARHRNPGWWRSSGRCSWILRCHRMGDCFNVTMVKGT